MKKDSIKNLKKIIVILLLLSYLAVMFLCFDLLEYLPIVLLLMIITCVCIYVYFRNNRSSSTIFKSKIKSILKTYDSILVKIDKLPNMKNKDIIFIDKFEDLINTQGETKKPIFYSQTDNTCAFVLIDHNLVCYSIIKEDSNLIDPFENKLITCSAERNVKDIDESILADLDKTTIIKIPNVGSYKVSPVRKKKDTKDKEETKIVNHATERVRKYKEKLNKKKKTS